MQHGTLVIGTQVQAQTDREQRQAIACNHSATHLLHAALRQILGDHVQQKGSLVRSQDLRFDFSHPQAVTAQQLQQIQQLVNQQIHNNTPVQTATMPLEQARQQGAIALFGEKYADAVRVLTMGQTKNRQPFSVELCGGTHVQHTGEIHLFHIMRESGIAAGIRRIEAVIGMAAYQYLMQQLTHLNQLAQQLNTSPDKLKERCTQLLQQNKQQQKQRDVLQQRLHQQTAQHLLHQAEDIGQGIQLLMQRDDMLDNESMKTLTDQLKSRLERGVICLAACPDDKPVLVVAVTRNLTSQFHAGKLMQYLVAQIDGKGGGRPDWAQGGGNNAAALPQALASIKPWLQKVLGS